MTLKTRIYLSVDVSALWGTATWALIDLRPFLFTPLRDVDRQSLMSTTSRSSLVISSAWYLKILFNEITVCSGPNSLNFDRKILSYCKSLLRKLHGHNERLRFTRKIAKTLQVFIRHLNIEAWVCCQIFNAKDGERCLNLKVGARRNLQIRIRLSTKRTPMRFFKWIRRCRRNKARKIVSVDSSIRWTKKADRIQWIFSIFENRIVPSSSRLKIVIWR